MNAFIPKVGGAVVSAVSGVKDWKALVGLVLVVVIVVGAVGSLTNSFLYTLLALVVAAFVGFFSRNIDLTKLGWWKTPPTEGIEFLRDAGEAPYVEPQQGDVAEPDSAEESLQLLTEKPAVHHNKLESAGQRLYKHNENPSASLKRKEVASGSDMFRGYNVIQPPVEALNAFRKAMHLPNKKMSLNDQSLPLEGFNNQFWNAQRSVNAMVGEHSRQSRAPFRR